MTEDKTGKVELSELSSPLPSSKTKIEKKEEIENPDGRGRKPLSKHPEHVLTFKALRIEYPEVAKAILSLCSIGRSQGSPSVVLRGRWGAYSTNRLRKEIFRQGESVLSRIKESVGQIEGKALDNLQEEGMVFASYDSLIEYLKANDHILPSVKREGRPTT